MAASLTTFICIDLADDIKRSLERVTRRLSRLEPFLSAGDSIRWVTREQMHVTLCFLGEVDWNQTAQICQIANRVLAAESPWTISCEGLGGFPTLDSLRVLWNGVREIDGTSSPNIESAAPVSGESAAADCPRLTDLGSRLVQEFLEHRFFPDTKPLRPHVTLARVSGGRESRLDAAEVALEQITDVEFGIQTVREFKLMTSERTRQGPVYRPIATLPLGKKR